MSTGVHQTDSTGVSGLDGTASNPSVSPASAWGVSLLLSVVATCCALPLLLASGILAGWVLFGLPTVIAVGALVILSLYWAAGRSEKRVRGPTDALFVERMGK
ncbi:MAG: hypothetical protein JRN35_10555 [Nitrososphaerota archaeon]|nr:hypothetical protein [Nitrososphaerota archaeon]